MPWPGRGDAIPMLDFRIDRRGSLGLYPSAPPRYTAPRVDRPAMESALALLSLSGDGLLDEELDGLPMQWRDALASIDAAADAMKLGDLLHGQCFSMHDAMSALEMMDPQMDAGMATADQPPPPPPPAALELTEFVAIVDEMLRGEVAWYSGLPLVQTVFRLDWLHATREPCDERLGAVMMGAVRSAAAVRALIMRNAISEEEDFSSSSSGVDLRDDVQDADVLKRLVVEEEAAAGALSAAKGGEGGSQDDGRIALLGAVMCRLRLRRSLFCLLGNLLRPGPKPLETCRRMLALCQGQIQPVRESIGLGAPADALNCLSGRASAKLLGSAPQRKIDLPSREDALSRLEELLAQIKAVFAIDDVADLDALQAWAQAAVGGKEANVLARSYAHAAGVNISII